MRCAALAAAAAALGAFGAGCQRTEERINEAGAERDVARWIAESHADIDAPSCDWVQDGTRTARCTSHATPAQIDQLVRGAQLAADTYADATSFASHPLACRAVAGFAEPSAGAVKTYRRFNGFFKYELVAYRPDTGDVCIELEYGWG